MYSVFIRGLHLMRSVIRQESKTNHKAKKT